MIVYFEEQSTTDWGLKLYDLQLSPPEPQTVYVDVPFRDGPLDFSTALTGGIVRYKNRTLTMGFDFSGSWSEWLTAISKINNTLLGQKLRIRTELEPEYYYLGRCTVSNLKDSFAIGSITVTATCDPYKYKLSPTVKEFDVSGRQLHLHPVSRPPHGRAGTKASLSHCRRKRRGCPLPRAASFQ